MNNLATITLYAADGFRLGSYKCPKDRAVNSATQDVRFESNGTYANIYYHDGTPQKCVRWNDQKMCWSNQ